MELNGVDFVSCDEDGDEYHCTIRDFDGELGEEIRNLAGVEVASPNVLQEFTTFDNDHDWTLAMDGAKCTTFETMDGDEALACEKSRDF